MGEPKKRLTRKEKAEQKRWDEEHVTPDGPEQLAYLLEMREKMQHYECDFMTYSQGVDMYLKEDKQAKVLYRMNQDYCRQVIGLCLHPLEHGCTPGNLLCCVSAYVGMSLVNPELRAQCNEQVVAALHPFIEKWTKLTDPVVDFERKRLQGLDKMARTVTGKGIGGEKMQKFINERPQDETYHERMMDLHDRVMKTRNYGRVPLTPEVAGLQRVNFAIQYYKAMRDPSADQDEAAQAYRRAQESLTKLADMDGIPEDVVNKNAMAYVGQLCSQVPECAAMFSELSSGAVMKGEGTIEEAPDGRKYEVWCGEYVDTETGKAWTEGFTAREPASSVEAMRSQVETYYRDIYKDCDTFMAYMGATQTPEFAQSVRLMKDMLRDDKAYVENLTGKAVDVDEVFDSAMKRLGAEWAEEHPDAVKEMADWFMKSAEEAKRAQQARAHFDNIPEQEEGGPSYGE